jgi:hypothetical protein
MNSFSGRRLKEIYHLEGRHISGRIILKRILKKKVARMWIIFM